MLRKMTITVLVFALAIGWLHVSQIAASTRQSLAESWISDDAQFTAIGLSGENLAAFLPYGDSVGCDAFLDNVLTDKATIDSLRTQGFREIACGQRKTTI